MILKIIEFEPEKLGDLIVPRTGETGPYHSSNDALTRDGLWDADELKQLTNHPDAPSWSCPEIPLVAGREARYSVGGSVPVQRRTDDGVSHPSDETYGRSIIATAAISDLNRIQLTVVSEVSDRTTSDGMAATGNKRCIDATFEMNHGETRVFGRKVVSTSGKETYQLIQATARLKPFEIPVDPDAIPVSAVEELSTPETDIAEFNATSPFRIDSFEPADTKSESGDLQRPNSLAADDSMLVRHLRRIDDDRIDDEALVSIIVIEVAQDDFEVELQRLKYHYIGWRPPSFYWNFPTDVVEVEMLADPLSSRSQSTKLGCDEWSSGICRRKGWAMQPSARTWEMPTALVESAREFQWRSGGEAPVVRLDQYRRESIASEQYGLTVSAVPTITDHDEIQLQLDITLKDLVQGATSPRVQSTRRMQSTVRVRTGEIVTFGQPAVSDTGRESFISFSVIASPVSSHTERALDDGEAISASFPENVEPIRPHRSLIFDSKLPFQIGPHRNCWADSIPENFKKINNILETIEYCQPLPLSAEASRLSYLVADPSNRLSELFSEP